MSVKGYGSPNAIINYQKKEFLSIIISAIFVLRQAYDKRKFNSDKYSCLKGKGEDMLLQRHECHISEKSSPCLRDIPPNSAKTHLSIKPLSITTKEMSIGRGTRTSRSKDINASCFKGPRPTEGHWLQGCKSTIATKAPLNSH